MADTRTELALIKTIIYHSNDIEYIRAAANDLVELVERKLFCECGAEIPNTGQCVACRWVIPWDSE